MIIEFSENVEDDEIDDEPKKNKIYASVFFKLFSVMDNSKQTQMIFLITRMITEDNAPFILVERNGFNLLINFLILTTKLPT